MASKPASSSCTLSPIAYETPDRRPRETADISGSAAPMTKTRALTAPAITRKCAPSLAPAIGRPSALRPGHERAGELVGHARRRDAALPARARADVARRARQAARHVEGCGRLAARPPRARGQGPHLP